MKKTDIESEASLNERKTEIQWRIERHDRLAKQREQEDKNLKKGDERLSERLAQKNAQD